MVKTSLFVTSLVVQGPQWRVHAIRSIVNGGDVLCREVNERGGGLGIIICWKKKYRKQKRAAFWLNIIQKGRKRVFYCTHPYNNVKNGGNDVIIISLLGVCNVRQLYFISSLWSAFPMLIYVCFLMRYYYYFSCLCFRRFTYSAIMSQCIRLHSTYTFFFFCSRTIIIIL